jgi:hypothetical protein
MPLNDRGISDYLQSWRWGIRKGLTSGTFDDVAGETEILVSNENGRGIALADLNNDDHLDIICGNWEGNHRIFFQLKAKSVRPFRNVASAFFEHPSPIRTVIVADFDNDIQTDIFMNNILRNNDSQSNSL